jgi:hypothetical protein
VKVKDQLHAPTALVPGKDGTVNLRYEAAIFEIKT